MEGSTHTTTRTYPIVHTGLAENIAWHLIYSAELLIVSVPDPKTGFLGYAESACFWFWRFLALKLSFEMIRHIICSSLHCSYRTRMD